MVRKLDPAHAYYVACPCLSCRSSYALCTHTRPHGNIDAHEHTHTHTHANTCTVRTYTHTHPHAHVTHARHAHASHTSKVKRSASVGVSWSHIWTYTCIVCTHAHSHIDLRVQRTRVGLGILYHHACAVAKGLAGPFLAVPEPVAVARVDASVGAVYYCWPRSHR